MKRLVILMAAGLLFQVVYTQVESPVVIQPAEKLTREERKEQRKAEEEATARLVEWMVNNRHFILEANYLSNTPYNKTVVDSRLNFIMVDSSKITIQLASSTGVGGLNGMGGLTTEGDISKYVIHQAGKKNPYYNIQIYTMSIMGSWDIWIAAYPSGNANATISGTSGTKLHFEGKLIPIEESRIYKGVPF